MTIYGEDMAKVYDELWQNFSARMWPFISGVVHEQVPDASEWLDLCCGSGHLLEILEREGFAATGLDLSPHLLVYAEQRAPGARLVQEDIRQFDLDHEFDVITCLFDSINYLTQQPDLERVFRNAMRHLRKPGLFVFDVDTLVGYRDRQYVPSVKRSDEMVVVMEGWFKPDQECRHSSITGFIREGALYRRFEEEHIQRGYRPEQVDVLLEKTAFEFDSYDGRTFAEPRAESDRLVYVCRKKG